MPNSLNNKIEIQLHNYPVLERSAEEKPNLWEYG